MAASRGRRVPRSERERPGPTVRGRARPRSIDDRVGCVDESHESAQDHAAQEPSMPRSALPRMLTSAQPVVAVTTSCYPF